MDKLQNFLGNPKDKLEMQQTPRIYKIACKNCDQINIGQT